VSAAYTRMASTWFLGMYGRIFGLCIGVRRIPALAESLAHLGVGCVGLVMLDHRTLGLRFRCGHQGIIGCLCVH